MQQPSGAVRSNLLAQSRGMYLSIHAIPPARLTLPLPTAVLRLFDLGPKPVGKALHRLVSNRLAEIRNLQGFHAASTKDKYSAWEVCLGYRSPVGPENVFKSCAEQLVLRRDLSHIGPGKSTSSDKAAPVPLAPAVDGENANLAVAALNSGRHSAGARGIAQHREGIFAPWPRLHVGVETPYRTRLIKDRERGRAGDVTLSEVELFLRGKHVGLDNHMHTCTFIPPREVGGYGTAVATA